MSAALLSSRPLRVVIVDDTPDLRELLRLALARGGMEVVGEAGDGLAGIETVRLEQPDLVLLDLSMPVMDGLEALPTIRRLVPRATIVVLSGFGATQLSERALAQGADGYVHKGTSLKRVLDQVRGIVAGTTDTGARPDLAVVPETSAAPGSDHGVSAWDALALAPYGVLEVADEPLFRIVYANPAAQRLLDNRARSGVPLGTVAPLLGNLVAFNRRDGEASFVAEVNGVGVQATLRRGAASLLIYLDPTAEDVGVLRRAIALTAHELRGPVAVLCGVAEALERDGGREGDGVAEEMTAEQRARLLSSVTRQARLLDSITADLLTAADLQRGSLRLDRQPIDPLDVLVDLVPDPTQVTVKSVGLAERTVLADPARLEQMLGNLLGNARKHGRPPYQLVIRADDDRPGLVAIDVADAGDGVPTAFLDELFGEHRRGLGPVATGVGLGLYVVRSLAEAHGGGVDYTPSDAGGARFTLWLPAV